jgi:MFS family permease
VAVDPPLDWRILVATSATRRASAAARAFLAELLSQLSVLGITVIFAAYAVGVVASLFLAGHLSDWAGRRRMVLLAVLVNMLPRGAAARSWRPPRTWAASASGRSCPACSPSTSGTRWCCLTWWRRR